MDPTLNMSFVQSPVLIVGSSMVGMTLSVLLAKQGIEGCIAIDRHLSTAIHPRAVYFHTHTMAVYRELGLYEDMKRESTKYYDENAGIVDVESLAGKFNTTWLKNMNEGVEKISPTGRLFLTQQIFEPILRSTARELGSDTRFGTELVSFQQDSDGVTALLCSVETGEKTLIRAKYLIACDGNRSSTREKLGIKMRGYGLLSHSVTIYFKADVRRYIEGKYNGVIYINNPTVRGFIRVDKTGQNGFFALNTAGPQGTEDSRFPADTITDELAAEYLRAAFGADIDLEIELIAKWRAVSDNAEAYNQGRVILAGDAAHTLLPNGGFGGNTGIHDVHNLAWKLELVLKGLAGRDLVEQTYHDERHPIGALMVNQVYARYANRTAQELKTTVGIPDKELPDLSLEMGYRYHSRALMTEDLDEITEDPRISTARPGSKAPHAQLEIDGKSMLVADLLGDSFVLLIGRESKIWEDAVEKLSLQARLPVIQCHRVHGEAFDERYRLGLSGAVFIRPDGFVAWTCTQEPSTPEEARDVLETVFEKILCLDVEEHEHTLANGISAPSVAVAQAGVLSLAVPIVLFEQEKALVREKEQLAVRMAVIEERIADLRRMSALQNEIAMLAMKLVPAVAPLVFDGSLGLLGDDVQSAR
ncbi:hypothetical protein K402DRAFT_452946 [Aulographum hederae CBS 113979]|uniref:FAD-binding domain-containing protein n=1 Tax=Aulographum hederae CBS 113979 TaxID=1176131 RepID=A0A6G1H591_9PEZI|nr:hypothetical protein K402DRAFT_452946 [Aulographum hederae CBS 113979]